MLKVVGNLYSEQEKKADLLDRILISGLALFVEFGICPRCFYSGTLFSFLGSWQTNGGGLITLGGVWIFFFSFGYPKGRLKVLAFLGEG